MPILSFNLTKLTLYHQSQFLISGSFIKPIRKMFHRFLMICTMLLTATLFWLAILSFPEDLDQFKADFIIAQFIKGPFIIQIFALVFWFIQSIKPIPKRISEFKFLLSLPVRAKQILIQFLVSDFIRYSWLLFVLSAAFLALAAFSSLSFLSRPILLSINFFILNISLSTFLNILLFNKGFHSKSNYLFRLNPFIQGIIFVIHGGLLLVAILIPLQINTWSFWVIFLSLLTLNLVLILFSASLFTNHQMKNSWLIRSSFTTETDTQIRLSEYLKYWTSQLSKHPMLAKNMIQGWRSNTQVSNIILACCFIIIAYSLAMNNTDISDRISVILGLTILFEIFFSVRIIQGINSELESTKIIFTMPITKSQHYFSILLPALLWCVTMIVIMTLLLIIWDSGFLLSGWYFIKSIFAAVLFICAAVNFGLAGYPDLMASHKKYAYWIFLLFVCTAIFYSYRFEVALLFGLISFFFILKNNRFRTSNHLIE